ncbi:MAG: hypothetical protein K5696_05870, partial [Lachnospiraceae bacterium]|nr:hypothetical protein [Lachnospiraceae bacterium]
MTNHVMKSGSILYEHDKDTVKTLDIVAKGVIRATRDYCTIDLPAGSIIGIGETPNSPYTFTYEAGEEDVSLFSYPYESEASLVALFKANPKLLGMLVAGCIRFAKNLQNATVDTMSMARTEYAAVSAAQEDYEKLAISVGAKVREFRDLSWISEPSMLDTARGWHRDFVDDLFTYEAKFKKDFFPIPSIGLGIGLTIHSYAQESKAFISSIFDYLDSLRRNSEEFMTEYRNLKNRSVPGSAKDSVGESMDDSVHHCLDAIAAFARPSSELLDHFRKSLDRFMRHKDRYGSDDDIRRLRRELAADFYELYTSCFIATIGQTWEGIPIGVRMFLLFGFVDEQLAGEENTAKLSSITENFAPDLHCRVVTIVEWLMLIYRGKVMPSKNEFDLDYPNYLISLKRNGDITDAQANQLLNSAVDKLKFEIKNFFLSGNRLTFGRITTFVPVFDRDNVAKPLEMAYLNRKNVSEQIDRLRDIDFKAFCRQGVFSDPANGITTFFTTDEVLPYVILMPNVGSRASLWQEIDAKKRSTPARMIASIFHTENVEDTFIRLVGEFR